MSPDMVAFVTAHLPKVLGVLGLAGGGTGAVLAQVAIDEGNALVGGVSAFVFAGAWYVINQAYRNANQLRRQTIGELNEDKASLKEERDVLAEQRARLMAERDAARAERDAARAERDAAIVRIELLQDQLAHEKHRSASLERLGVIDRRQHEEE